MSNSFNYSPAQKAEGEYVADPIRIFYRSRAKVRETTQKKSED